MRLTVDTSVAVKWVISEPGSQTAKTYLPRWEGAAFITDHVMMAPALLGLELHNVISKRFAQRLASQQQLLDAEYVIEHFGTLDPVDTRLVDQARRISFGAKHWLAISRGQPRPILGTNFNIYDSVFVAHAHVHSATLLTADREQAQVARIIGIPVEFVSDAPE